MRRAVPATYPDQAALRSQDGDPETNMDTSTGINPDDSSAYSDTGEYDDAPDTDECSRPADQCPAFDYATGAGPSISPNRSAALQRVAIEHIRRHHPERWSETRGVLPVAADDAAV